VEHSDDLNSARASQLKDDVSSDRQAAQASQQFVSLASHPGLACERSKFAVDAGSKEICLTHTIFGNVRPNFREIGHSLRAYGDGRHLSGSFASRKTFSALLFHLVHAPPTRGTAIEAFADVPAQSFQLQSVQLILRFHEAQRFAHHLAGGVVASGVDLLADELFESGGQIDIQGHGAPVGFGFQRNQDWQRLSIIYKYIEGLSAAV